MSSRPFSPPECSSTISRICSLRVAMASLLLLDPAHGKFDAHRLLEATDHRQEKGVQPCFGSDRICSAHLLGSGDRPVDGPGRRPEYDWGFRKIARVCTDVPGYLKSFLACIVERCFLFVHGPLSH